MKKQHFNSTCMWSIYLSVDTISQRFVSYYDFLDGVAANKETTEKWKSSL
jgi:hypothetical protein